MDEERFDGSVRRFLKKLGVTAHREIEEAVRSAEEAGKLGGETLEVNARIRIGDLDLDLEVKGTLDTA